VSVLDRDSNTVVFISGHAEYDTIAFTDAEVVDPASLIAHDTLAIPVI
jgi:hypothetical protein